MTVALPPDLADLLGQTGHRWPDADEDQLVTMADGWKGLQAKLDTVRADNNQSAQQVLASNRGPGMDAFREFVKKLDEFLLKLVELCARAEAILIAFARAVLAVKKAILNALEWLARAIAAAKRGASHIPVIGGLISEAIEKVVEPVFNAVRRIVTEVVTRIADLIINTIVPILVELIRFVKGLIQGLRKLIKGQVGADWPTNPSESPDPERKPRGRPETWNDRDDDSTKRARRMENEAADTLARAGYDVEQQPPVPGSKNPDYRIEGKIFDCVSPETDNARSIWTNILRRKVETGQADRIIINIDSPDAKVSVEDLRRQFQDYPMPGLKEAKVIGPGGAIIDIYP